MNKYLTTTTIYTHSLEEDPFVFEDTETLDVGSTAASQARAGQDICVVTEDGKITIPWDAVVKVEIVHDSVFKDTQGDEFCHEGG